VHDALEVFWVLLGVGTAGSLVYGMVMLITGLHQRLVGRPGSLGEELEQRLRRLEAGELYGAELDELHARLTEAEERLDFAERLLAQREGHAELEPPSSSGITPTH